MLNPASYFLFILSRSFFIFFVMINIPIVLASGNVPALDHVNADNRLKFKQLSFCHVNIRSILATSDCGPRIDHLHNFACTDNNYDIIALTETHLSEDINDDELMFEGYDLFRLDRNPTRWWCDFIS